MYNYLTYIIVFFLYSSALGTEMENDIKHMKPHPERFLVEKIVDTRVRNGKVKLSKI